MANAAQSRATGPLFFLKTGCSNKILVASGNRAAANFEHCPPHGRSLEISWETRASTAKIYEGKYEA